MSSASHTKVIDTIRVSVLQTDPEDLVCAETSGSHGFHDSWHTLGVFCSFVVALGAESVSVKFPANKHWLQERRTFLSNESRIVGRKPRGGTLGDLKMDVAGSDLEILQEGVVVVVCVVSTEALVVVNLAPHLAFDVDQAPLAEGIVFGTASENV